MKRGGPVRQVLVDALGHFNADDGWAMASHVAISTLMAMFPFLIFVAAVAGMFDTQNLTSGVVALIFETWPEKVAGPIAREIRAVLNQPRGDLLTLGALFTLILASNGVEALRTALNRAYRVSENRNVVLKRLQSVLFVIVGALGLLALAFLIILAPLIWATVIKYIPALKPHAPAFNLIRFSVAGLVLVVALFSAHVWLANGRRRFRDTWPGIVATLLLWLIGAQVFATYLAGFADYVSTYAGLASAMTALIFLYLAAVVFILGAELNVALIRLRRAREQHVGEKDSKVSRDDS